MVFINIIFKKHISELQIYRQRFLDSRKVPGFTIGFWIHDGFLDSWWVLGFTIGSWMHDRFLDSR